MPSTEALTYAGVRIIDVPISIDREYTYYIPRELDGDVRPGVFVSVPFGGGNRRKSAVVTSLIRDPGDMEYKPVYSVTNTDVTLTEELMGLCEFISSHTVCSFGDAVKSCVPAGAVAHIRVLYSLSSQDAAADGDDETAIINYLRRSPSSSYDAIRRELSLGGRADKLLSSLVKKGVISRSFEVKEPTNKEKFYTLSLAVDPETAKDACNRIRSIKSSAVLSYIIGNGGECSQQKLAKELGDVRSQIKTLKAHGLITRTEHVSWRLGSVGVTPTSPSAPHVLSEEQEAAFSRLKSLFDSGEPKAALLHGVTGSGKTSVIRAMIDHVTKSGKSVIILVPEIALTPQTVGIFCSAYGERVAVMHSSLSEGERIDAWRRVRSGEADIVIGTRSAVFAPVERLGMIVIDEEQEHTYKSETSPKYDAHDVARYRCAAHGALMLLSSATPSLASYHKAESGLYTLVELKKRYGGARLPEVIIADRRREADRGASSPIGDVLRGELSAALAKGEQAILFLNRRGYNRFLSCKTCGEAVMCPHCSVAMTYHTMRRIEDTDSRESYREEHIRAGRLVCHYCGYQMTPPDVCPSCGGGDLLYMGFGTQRVCDEVAELFPSARVLRMDADTTKTKSSYDEILGKFSRHEADVLIGTQMVTKGHDFPDVTLVGVLLAESSLYLDDYRAGERTFSLITQVIGRAGRASRPGRAVIQTYTPDNTGLRTACSQDYGSFYNNEIKLRRAYEFPPFCDIAELNVTSGDEVRLASAMVSLTEHMKCKLSREYPDVKIMIFGPFEAPIYRINEKYRMRIVCKCRLTKRSRAFFSELMRGGGQILPKGMQLSIDLNPNSI